MTDIHVALDLGNDTIKIAYAYLRNNVEHTGKLVADPMSAFAIPSVAYFDTDTEEWLYGDEVDNVGDKSFITVVKICDLLRLLDSAEENKNKNVKYFKDGHEFPKFFFPRTRALTDDFTSAIEREMTFSDPSATPQSVCAAFMKYVAGVVKTRLDILVGEKNYNIVPCLVYPAFSDKTLVTTLVRFVRDAFGKAPSLQLSMAKSLCAYADYSGKMTIDVPGLIFNIGEERMSVVKVVKRAAGITIDGADGHSDPADIGGKDIDDAVARHIEGLIANRESMGRPSAGEDGHIAENALSTKQYLFMKDIKSAKTVFGMPLYDNTDAFKNGVPVSSQRDLVFRRYIKRDEFCGCIGLDDNGNVGVASKFCEYIMRELALTVNGDVKKVYITGGPVETYGLVDYIKYKVKRLYPAVDILTFEKPDSEYDDLENDGFNIMSHEDALYSPVLGCAIASLRKMKINLVLAQSYGVRVFRNMTYFANDPITGVRKEYKKTVRYFRVLVNKGEIIDPAGNEYFARFNACTKKRSESDSLPILSIDLTESDIKRRALSNKGVEYEDDAKRKEILLVCNDTVRDSLRPLEKNAGFRVLTGDIEHMTAGNTAKFKYNGVKISICPEGKDEKSTPGPMMKRESVDVQLLVGLRIDGDGYAHVFAKNDEETNRGKTVFIQYNEDVKQDGQIVKRKGEYERVRCEDIEIKYELNAQLS